jgi:Protein of unknown function (DUF3039)
MCHAVNVSETQTDTRQDQRTDHRTSTGDGDHDRFAHYVNKAAIVSSAVLGHEVEALCGKKWIPSRDPERYPVCPECKAIYATRFSG